MESVESTRKATADMVFDEGFVFGFRRFRGFPTEVDVCCGSNEAPERKLIPRYGGAPRPSCKNLFLEKPDITRRGRTALVEQCDFVAAPSSRERLFAQHKVRLSAVEKQRQRIQFAA